MIQEYQYNGRTSDGRLLKGSIWVSDEKAGLQRLRNQGISVITFVKQDLKNRGIKKSWKLKEVYTFFYQIHVLLRAGFTIIEAVHFYSRHTKNVTISKVTRQIAEDIRHGSSLYEALQRANLPNMSLQWIYLSEQTGQLEGTCLEIYEYFKHKEDMQKKIIKIISYPAFVLVLSFMLFLMMTIFFLPQFFPVYKGFGIEPPAFMVTLVGFGLFVQIYGMYIFIGLLGLALLSILYKAKITPFVKEQLLKIPLLKVIHHTQLLLLLSIMLKAGINLYEALQIMVQSSYNQHEIKQYLNWAEKIREGNSLSSLLQSHSFNPLYVQMIKVGENSGELQDMLEKSAEYGKELVQEKVDQSLAILQPLLIFVMGIIIGTMIYTVFLPISNILDKV